MSTENVAHHHEEGAVLLEQNGPIAMITLSRPAALNAMTWTMYQQLEAHLVSLAAGDTTRAIIIHGEGKAFAAGTDIQQFQGFSGEDGIAYEHKMEAIVERLYTISKPKHLVDSFGSMRTKEMLFTGRLLTATDAVQCGFLTAITDEERLITHVTGVAQQISSLAPLTIWSVKEAQARLNAAEKAIDYDDVLARIYGSSDFAEGVQAYLEKRKPDWRGQ
ncbi:MAG: hypothetical protein E6I79_16175 [Chloroflexi bacterium]|nr:MAG: hypothetical protein E6I79_16175 [Chloroflexota bacterium]